MERSIIEKALSQVMDPELNRSLVELKMVEDIQIDADNVSVTVALTTKGCPLKDTIVKSVQDKLAEIPGIGQISVKLGEMSPEQRAKLMGGPKPGATPSPASRVVAVASGKGGVGKSTVTVNLAAALRRKGFSVGVLDCDIYGFSVPRLLGVEDKKPGVSGDKILPVSAHGLKAISMGNLVEDNAPVIWRGPMLGKVIRQFLTDVEWGNPDFLLLDLPPGTGDVALDVANALPDASLLVVTTPEKVAAGVASRAAQMARKTGQDILGVVENMSSFICPHCGEPTAVFGEGGGSELAEELKVPLLGQIPLTIETRQQGDAGKPVAFLEDSPVAASYKALADKVAEALQMI